MPREDRRIIFEDSEVYKAIYALCSKQQLKVPPPGMVRRIYQNPHDPGSICIDLENPQDSTSRKLEYSQDFFAAALMLFCKGCGIPLPKTAQKSVVLLDGKVVLRVLIGG